VDVAVVQLEVVVVVLVEVEVDVEDMAVVVIKWMILYQTIHQKEVDSMVALEVEEVVAEVVGAVEMIVGHPQTVEEMTVWAVEVEEVVAVAVVEMIQVAVMETGNVQIQLVPTQTFLGA